MNEDKNIFGQNTKKSNHKHLFRTEHRPQQQQAASPQTEKQPKRSCKRSQKNRKITAFRPSPSTFTHVNTNKKQIIQQRPAVCLDRFVLRHCLKLEAQVARTQGAQKPFHLPKKYTETKTLIFWCKTTWGTTFTKSILPLVGGPH